MGSRLGSRGLAITLAIVALLFVAPTPVPRQVAEAWAAAQAAALAGDTLSAKQALASLQSLSAWLPATKSDAIRVALANGDGELARTLLEAPPAPQASQQTVGCWRSETLALLGEWKAAAESLSSIDVGGCPNPGSLLKRLAASKLQSNDLSAATSILQTLAPLYPQDAETTSLLGACLVLEEPESALTAIRQAAAQGDPLAVDLASALDALPMGDASALAASGQVFLKYGLWPMAAEAFRQLVAQEPGSASAHAYRGLALDEQGLDGLAEMEIAASLEPESAAIESLLGLHWQLQGQPQKAIPYLESAVELEPDNSAFRASLAAAEAEAGDVQAAIASYQQAAELRPTDPVFWRLLAGFSIGQEIELDDTALPAARNAVVLDAEDPTALDLAGYAHFLLGDQVTAERLLIRSLDLDPASASARLHYGLLLASAGRTSEARMQLTSAASLGGSSPSGLFARRALAQLAQ
jgi:Flp pilus assembly protein TadD